MMLLIICFSGILMAGRQSYNNIIQFLSGGMYQKKGFKKPAHADITTKMYNHHLFFKKFVAEKSSYVVSRVLKIWNMWT